MRIYPNSSGTSQGRQGAVLQPPCLATQRKDELPESPTANQSGFTLLEIMIVMVIMAVISAIAIPAFSSWREKQAVRSASQSLMAHLKQARLLALAENRNVSIVFSTSAYTFDAAIKPPCLKTPPDNPADTSPCKNNQINLSQFSNSLTVTVNRNPAQITFTSRGTVKKNSHHHTT